MGRNRDIFSKDAIKSDSQSYKIADENLRPAAAGKKRFRLGNVVMDRLKYGVLVLSWDTVTDVVCRI